MLEKSSSDTAVIQPIAGCACKMPLPDDHHQNKDDDGNDYPDQYVERHYPCWVERKCAKESERPKDQKETRYQAVKKVFRCNGRQTNNERYVPADRDSLGRSADQNSQWY